MSESKIPFLPSPDHAVAAVDGSTTVAGSAAGCIMIHDGVVMLRGLPLPEIRNSWESEAYAVVRAIKMALELRVQHLRLLIDHHDVACIVQGRPANPGIVRELLLEDWIRIAHKRGMKVSARIVQGHTGTDDLPSRMNETAHVLGNLARIEPVYIDLPHSEDWFGDLVKSDGRFEPDRKRPSRPMQREKAASFLGLDMETVNGLVRAGYLSGSAHGISRETLAQVYVIAQHVRHDAYFGFLEREREPGQWLPEISRGWNAMIERQVAPALRHSHGNVTPTMSMAGA